MRKRLAAVLLVLCLLMLTGCSAGNKAAPDALHVTMINTYVPMDAPEALQTKLKAALPEWADAVVSSVSSGDPEKDPMAAMAGMTQIAGMMATGEMELLLCDAANARRHGDNGSLFVPLDELFTAEEQKELGIVPVTVPLLDDEGQLTGEMSAPCGIDLSACAAINQTMCTDDVAAYVLVDSPHTEDAKAVIRWLLSAK